MAFPTRGYVDKNAHAPGSERDEIAGSERGAADWCCRSTQIEKTDPSTISEKAARFRQLLIQ